MPRIIVDLDHTLLDTTRFKAALAKSLDLTQASWDEAYHKFVSDYGMFNPDDFLRGVAAEQKKNFMAVVQKTGTFLYPDSLPFLHKAQEAGYRVVVLTFGQQAWQKQKLDHISWPAGVATTTTDTTKLSQLAEYMADDTLIVDDRATELDAIAQRFPKAQLYWMRRPNGKYRDVAPNVTHQVISSLIEINL